MVADDGLSFESWNGLRNSAWRARALAFSCSLCIPIQKLKTSGTKDVTAWSVHDTPSWSANPMQSALSTSQATVRKQTQASCAGLHKQFPQLWKDFVHIVTPQTPYASLSQGPDTRGPYKNYRYCYGYESGVSDFLKRLLPWTFKNNERRSRHGADHLPIGRNLKQQTLLLLLPRFA